MKTVETDIAQLIASHRDGMSLQQSFYTDSRIFEYDAKRLILKQWMLVAHESRLPNNGDYVLYGVAGESIIVIRAQDGTIRAHFNVCRHRGSRICLEPAGNLTVLVCPYHAWAYRTDGRLLHARGMPNNFDTNDNSLHACQVRVWHGLVFINPAHEDDPGVADFAQMTAALDQFIWPNQTGRAKIAAEKTFPTTGNWKLAVENFRECLHCAPAHPEYTVVNAYVKANEKHADGFLADIAAWESIWSEKGYITGRVSSDTTDQRQPCGALVRPIQQGWKTMSENGNPVAPLMGEYKEFTGGICFMFLGPLTYIYAANDHVVLIRLIPKSTTDTETQVTWLVCGDAEEGKDYAPDRLMWLWDKTVTQDCWLIANNQCGVNSRRYQPGQYATGEDRLTEFIRWYMHRLQAE